MKERSRPLIVSIAGIGIATVIASHLVDSGVAQAQGPTNSFVVASRSLIAGRFTGPTNASAVADQTGTQNDASKFLRTTKGKHESIAVFNVDPSIRAAQMGLRVNVRVPTVLSSPWTWSAYDWSSKKWATIGSLSASPLNVWTNRTFTLEAPASRFVSPTGTVRVRLRNASRKAQLDIDHEELLIGNGNETSASNGTPTTTSRSSTATTRATATAPGSTSPAAGPSSGPAPSPGSATPSATTGTSPSSAATPRTSPSPGPNPSPGASPSLGASPSPNPAAPQPNPPAPQPNPAVPTPGSNSTTTTSTTTTAATTTTTTTTTTLAPTTTTTTRPPVVTGSAWVPSQADRWLYQIGTATPDLTICEVPVKGGACVKPTVWALDLYASDGTTPNSAAVSSVHGIGGRVVCYLSGGSHENWRPDQATFPAAVLGSPLDGWPGERWLDVRALTTLRPIMTARAQKCKDAGFDAIDWDNVDGYTNKTGFPLTGADQLAYNRMLASITKGLGLAVGLKNDLNQIPDLVGFYDFVVNEQCSQYNECATLLPFSNAGKAVVQIEYTSAESAYCPNADANKWSAIKMSLNLNPRPWKPCS